MTMKGSSPLESHGECSIVRTQEQEKKLRETMEFMRKFGSKITLFLSLSQGGEIGNQVNELTERDLDGIDAFFEKLPDASIQYDSEVVEQRITISLETMTILKEKVILRIFGRFLDIFDKHPSRYALHGIIRSGKKYEEISGISIISEETIKSKQKLLLEKEIKGQEDAISNGIYNDEETQKRKNERLNELEIELHKLET